MEQRRTLLIVLLVVVGALLWHNWTMEHLPPAVTVTPTALTTDNNVAIAVANNNNAQPAVNQAPSAVPVPTASTQQAAAELIHVKTDVLDVDINTQGGTLTRAALLAYPLEQGKPAPVVLLNDDPASRYLAQSSLVSTDNQFSDSHLVYQATQTDYQLNNQKQVVVNLTYQDPASGIKLVKSYTFTQGLYNVGVTYTIQNNSNALWQANLYGLLSRTSVSDQNSGGLFHINSYTGASVSTANSPYQKVSFKDMQKENLNTTSNGGWAAMQQHYFLSAWVPDQKQKNRYFTQVDNNGLYTVGVAGPTLAVQPGQTASTSMQLYVGPELGNQLKALAPHLDLTIDYGWLWFISDAIFWLMQHIYNLLGNWGWSIVLVTLLIKLIFYPLSATSYRSMAKMRKLQPKLQSLKDRYGDDRQKLAQATMELYRQEKANPMSGCLPIIVQIPVFIALYWVIIESVQLRQAPFIFWIHDLSSRDPYFILPILNGLAMYVQQKLNPAPPDPTQAKIMAFLPLLFTFIFINFPAGLVLYWIVNSLVSVLQQWYITRQVENEDKVVVIPKAEK